MPPRRSPTDVLAGMRLLPNRDRERLQVRLQVRIRNRAGSPESARVHRLYRAPGEIQGKVRGQVEKDDADLVNRHPRVVQHVELLDGKTKPAAVKQIQPVVRQDKDQKPQRQYGVVDQCTAQQRASHRLDSHNLPPVLKVE